MAAFNEEKEKKNQNIIHKHSGTATKIYTVNTSISKCKNGTHFKYISKSKPHTCWARHQMREIGAWRRSLWMSKRIE